MKPGIGRSGWIRIVNRAYENLPADTEVTRAQIRKVLTDYARQYAAIEKCTEAFGVRIGVHAVAAQAVGISQLEASSILTFCAEDAALVLVSPEQERTVAARRRKRITSAVLAEVAEERARQHEKWGEQNHPDVHPRQPGAARAGYGQMAEYWKAENAARVDEANAVGVPIDRNCAWDGVFLEEVFEALGEEDPAKLRAELVQAAAVAVAWIEAIDRRAS